ncbi:MAG: XdhC family protein, partial [Halohasta sp.]
TNTAAVVATHNFIDDRLTVAELLETPVPYVGVVGSRDRFERLLEALDRRLSAADQERLYGPAGLDLGGETPEQIALSVVSEALSVRNDRTPGHLRERAGTIHERSSPGSDQSQ